VARAGWRVMRVSSEQVRRDVERAVAVFRARSGFEIAIGFSDAPTRRRMPRVDIEVTNE
jgi:hypothetical protein